MISPASGPTMCAPRTRSVSAIDYQLHHGALVASRHRVFHRPERRFEDAHVGVLLARLSLRQSDGADVRLAEHGRWHAGVVERSILAVEQIVGHDHAFGDRNRRQLHTIDHVADRVDVVDTECGIDRRPQSNRARSARHLPPRARSRAPSANDRSRTAPGRHRSFVHRPVRRGARRSFVNSTRATVASNLRSMCFSRS